MPIEIDSEIIDDLTKTIKEMEAIKSRLQSVHYDLECLSEFNPVAMGASISFLGSKARYTVGIPEEHEVPIIEKLTNALLQEKVELHSRYHRLRGRAIPNL